MISARLSARASLSAERLFWNKRSARSAELFRAMQKSQAMNPCNVSNLVTKKLHDIHDTSGRYMSEVNSQPELETKYFLWGKARYYGLALGPKRDKRWWNALDSQKHRQQWFNDGVNESIVVPIPLRSILDMHYNRLSHEAKSPIESAKRGALRGARIQFNSVISCGLISFPRCSCAVGGRRDNPEEPAASRPRLQRRRCPGLRCDRCSPRDRRVAVPRSG